jgi:hypothetical protein
VSTGACAPDDVLNHVPAGADVIVPVHHGEPHTLMDVLEANADRLSGVRVHQMDPARERAYIRGEFPGRLEHVGYFLGPGSRQRTGTAPASSSPRTSARQRAESLIAIAHPDHRDRLRHDARKAGLLH